MAHDVFISHAASDKSVADAACATLEEAGIRCWIAPRDVQPGRSFAGEITRAIQGGKAMVLIFSAHSNNSEQVLREIQLAVDARIHIVQFRIEEVAPSDDLQYYLSTEHWLDAITPPLEAHLKRLKNSIQTLLNVPVSETAARAQPAAIAPQPVAQSTTREPATSSLLSLPLALKARLPWLIAAAAVAICGVTIFAVQSRRSTRYAETPVSPSPQQTPVAATTTLRPVLTDSASSTSPPVTGRVFIPPSWKRSGPSYGVARGFLGSWTNKDFNTRGITRVRIRFESDQVIVHMWGRCRQEECDWGETAAQVPQGDDKLLMVTWDVGFAVRSQELKLNPDGILEVVSHTVMTKTNGRRDETYWFAKGLTHGSSGQ